MLIAVFNNIQSEMDLETTQNSKKSPPLKKKVKNKGWNAQPQQEFTQLPTLKDSLKQSKQEQQKKIQPTQITPPTKNLSEMAQKYAIDMNAELGNGFASVVYLAINIQTKERVCAKIIDYYCLGSEKQRRFLQRQIATLKMFNSDKIVKILDVYQSPSFCYLIMQFCPGGDLYRFILRNEPLSIPVASHIVAQICDGVKLLKDKEIIHRDLKTENIFLGEKLEVKIGDLGFCVSTKELSDNINVGSPIYMSPQVLAHQPFSFQSDIYGVGIIWYEILHKHAPWEAKTEAELLFKKINQPLAFAREDIPEQEKAMIGKCLSNDPSLRCSLEELIQFFKSKQSKQQ